MESLSPCGNKQKKFLFLLQKRLNNVINTCKGISIMNTVYFNEFLLVIYYKHKKIYTLIKTNGLLANLFERLSKKYTEMSFYVQVYK